MCCTALPDSGPVAAVPAGAPAVPVPLMAAVGNSDDPVTESSSSSSEPRLDEATLSAGETSDDQETLRDVAIHTDDEAEPNDHDSIGEGSSLASLPPILNVTVRLPATQPRRC
jgi:hypothetical protein